MITPKPTNTTAELFKSAVAFVGVNNTCDGCGLGETIVVDDPHAKIHAAVEKAIEALELYASCPEDSGIPERVINGGEHIGLGTEARYALTELRRACGGDK